MSWIDSDGLERGGDCNECGEPVVEEWHAYCRDCYADQQGWTRPDRDALREQHEDRAQISITRVVERLDELERRLGRLETMLQRGTAAA